MFVQGPIPCSEPMALAQKAIAAYKLLRYDGSQLNAAVVAAGQVRRDVMQAAGAGRGDGQRDSEGRSVSWSNASVTPISGHKPRRRRRLTEVAAAAAVASF
jgi:hypothetical protein